MYGDQTEICLQNLLFRTGHLLGIALLHFLHVDQQNQYLVSLAPPGKIQGCTAPPGICDQHPHYGAEKAFLNVLLHSAPPQHPCWEARTFFFFFACQLSSAPPQHPCWEARTFCFCQLGSAPPIKKIIPRPLSITIHTFSMDFFVFHKVNTMMLLLFWALIFQSYKFKL